MASNQINPDQFTAPFQLTKSMHRDVYPSVVASDPALSAEGRVVLITGASGGLGYATAQAWSKAGAAGLVLMGRSAEKLDAVATSLKSPSLVVVGNIAQEDDAKAAVDKSVSKFGRIDVLVNVAGSFSSDETTGTVEPAKWFGDFETNVKGTYLMCHYFIKATGGKGTIINAVSLGASFLFPGMSSYSISKLAMIKLGEFLDLEHPDLRVFSVHPGMVEAKNGRGIVVPALLPFSKDKAALFGGATLCLDKPEADFMAGGFYSVNWDLEELKENEKEIMEKRLLKLAFLNGQLQVGGYPWSSA